MTTTGDATVLAAVRAEAHPTCVFCGDGTPPWLATGLRPDGDGVSGTWSCPAASVGYPGLVHGGVVAGLLDAAMTNALFALGVAALTARLSLRYHHPVRLGLPACVRARVGTRRGQWWRTTATLEQDGRVAVSAEASFRSRPGGSR